MDGLCARPPQVRVGVPQACNRADSPLSPFPVPGFRRRRHAQSDALLLARILDAVGASPRTRNAYPRHVRLHRPAQELSTHALEPTPACNDSGLFLTTKLISRMPILMGTRRTRCGSPVKRCETQEMLCC